MEPLEALFKWKSLYKEWLNFGVSHFKLFFPKESDMTNVGKVYNMYQHFAGFAGTTSFSSNRYYPPQMEEELIILHRLLSMFHPRPFLRNRFPPQGGVATVRAYNDKYVDIAFRLVF